MGILAQAQGLTFELPRSQPQVALGQQSGQGAKGDVGSIMGAPPSGLQNVTGVTDTFYKKWGDLENMAQTAKIKYGIDVTRPDFSSAEAMELHKTFKQGLADVRFQGNKLQEAQKALTSYNKDLGGSQGDLIGYSGDLNKVFDPNLRTREPRPDVQGEITKRQGIKMINDNWQKNLDRESRLKIAKLKGNDKPYGMTTKRFDNAMEYKKMVSETAAGAQEYLRRNSKIESIERIRGEDFKAVDNDGFSKYYDVDRFVSNPIDEGSYDVLKDKKGDIIGIIDYTDMDDAKEQIGKYLTYVQAKPNPSELTDTPFYYPEGAEENDYNQAGWLAFNPSTYTMGGEEKTTRADAKAVKEITALVGDMSKASAKKLTEKLKGGFYQGKEVVKVTRNYTQDGNHEIEFKNGDKISIGGDLENSGIAGEIFLSKGKKLQQPEVVDVVDPNSMWDTGDGREFSYQQLIDLGNTPEQIAKFATQKK